MATQVDRATLSDLLRFRIGVDTSPLPILASPASEQYPALSPDGRWLAYASNESGRYEVYVSPFPDVNARKVQISVDGGAGPRWSRKGDELFFVSAAGNMMAARVRTGPTFAALRVDRLFNASRFWGSGPAPLFDVTADAQRFLMLDLTAASGDASSGRLVLVQNFSAELVRRVAK